MNRDAPRVFQSAITALAAGDTLSLDVDFGFPHVFVAVEFYKNSAGSSLSAPNAGTLTFAAKTRALPGTFQTVSGTVDLSSANVEKSIGANCVTVRVSGLSGVSGDSVTHCRLVAVCNRT